MAVLGTLCLSVSLSLSLCVCVSIAVCLQVLVLCVYQLINLSLSLCPNATTYSGLLADALGPRWAKAYDLWIALTIFGTSEQ